MKDPRKLSLWFLLNQQEFPLNSDNNIYDCDISYLTRISVGHLAGFCDNDRKLVLTTLPLFNKTIYNVTNMGATNFSAIAFDYKYGCDDILFSTAVVDSCGVCGGPVTDDCLTSYDLCGVCGGNSSSCTGSCTINGKTATYDSCGVCNGTRTSCKYSVINPALSVSSSQFASSSNGYNLLKYPKDRHKLIDCIFLNYF